MLSAVEREQLQRQAPVEVGETGIARQRRQVSFNRGHVAAHERTSERLSQRSFTDSVGARADQRRKRSLRVRGGKPGLFPGTRHCHGERDDILTHEHRGGMIRGMVHALQPNRLSTKAQCDRLQQRTGSSAASIPQVMSRKRAEACSAERPVGKVCGG